MKLKKRSAFAPRAFLSRVGEGRTKAEYAEGQLIFAQGDPAESIFYLQKGRVQLKVVSKRGKEASIAILGAGDFFGEGCLAGQTLRMSSAAAFAHCFVARIEKQAAIRVLNKEPKFSQLFIAYLLSRNIRIEEDLVDQLFNSSEMRLARVLLLLANFGEEGPPEPAMLKISQTALAEIVGTTRSRVNFFMNKFRKLGFVSYNGGLEVHSSLRNVVLND